ncbi:hypothetical protein [Streptomyces sp. NPDC102437]|uniref:hypothetical protein n=1 Tax=Streptomyces sp. NPDC102437 TaxID=3366175 RepID=UPI003805DEF2
MTDVPDTTAAEPQYLSPRDEARISFATRAFNLSTDVLDLIPVRPELPHGELLRQTLALRQAVDKLVDIAVIAERERGATWEQIGGASGTTRQSAHEKWSSDLTAWASNGRTSGHKKSPGTSMDRAKRIDHLYAALRPETADAVTAGLDAVRFPGSDVYERAQRPRAAALHARLIELRELKFTLHDQFKELTEEDESTLSDDQIEALAQNLTRTAETQDESAACYEELVAAEPALAEEHLASAQYQRQVAAESHKHAAAARRRREDQKARTAN